jgi:glycosyltransferase involved in cell wall biosynthesis
MSLSVCLIARNEESNLPRALRSVREVADEVIVADTGSTDATVEVARQWGASICHFPWCDDFSAARNHAIEQATGDWILWLDADEELLASSRGELLESPAREDVLACLVCRHDLVDPSTPEVYTQMWQLRLFRRRSDLRFRGRCHPEFHPPILEIAQACGQRVCTSGIALRHYGYVAEMRLPKLQRAARLLELELQDRPGQLYYMIEYGRTLLRIDPARGEEALARAAEQLAVSLHAAEAPTPMVAGLLEDLLQLPPDRLPAGFSRQRLFELSARWFPRSAPLVWWRARDAFDRGQFAEAERHLRLLVAMGRDHSYDRHISFDPRIVGGDAMLNLGVCLVRQAKLADAEKCFRSLLVDPVHAEAARRNLDAIARICRQSSKSRPARPRRRKRR